ncbi:hypothetical protein [Nocardia sp. NPDC057030]
MSARSSDTVGVLGHEGGSSAGPIERGAGARKPEPRIEGAA